MLWNMCSTVTEGISSASVGKLYYSSVLQRRRNYTDLPSVILVKLLLCLIPFCVLCIPQASEENALKIFLRVC